MTYRVKREKGTIFIALPTGEGRPIPGGCQCKYCVAHPDQTPRWDTIALDEQHVAMSSDWAVPVHYPELPR